MMSIYFFSFMKGIGTMLGNTVNCGQHQEIQLDQARLFIEQGNYMLIICVLVSNLVNRSLSSVFISFSQSIFNLVRNILVKNPKLKSDTNLKI